MDESILECPVCLDEFKHPVMPPCQHAFCFSCILKYIRESGAKCPICRTAFAEEDLRRSLHIEQLLSAKSGGLEAEEEEEEMGDESGTLVAALADLPPFKDDMDFEVWLKLAKFNLPLYPRRQRILRILRALPQDLFLAAIDAGITPDTNLEQCCDTLSQLVIDQEEQTLARDFFYRYQKVGEDDEEYAKNLQLLAERAFRGSPPNKVAGWIVVQFKHGVRPPIMVEKLCGMKTNSLSQLVKFATKKRQELLKIPHYNIPSRRSNPAPSYRASSRYTPRSGEERSGDRIA